MKKASLFGVLLVGCVVWTGCALDTQGEGSDVTASSALGLPPPPPPCPGAPGSLRTVAEGPGDHADASRFVAYLFGASQSQAGIPYNPACSQVMSTLDTIRNRIANGTDQLITYAANTTVCGLPSTVYEITNEGQTIAGLAPQVDSCIGHPGAAPFFYYKADAYNGYVDPQIATLTQNLSGSQGASATAYWSDTYTGTTAVEWPSTLQGGSWPGGMPCSTTGLYSGSQTGHLMAKLGGLERCQ